MLQNLLFIAINAALEAGLSILDIYNSEEFDVNFKDDKSPLTSADLKSHNIILKHLSDTKIPVLSEEGKDIPYETRKNWKKLWIIDPIDGTKEFIKRNGEFTVNIALVVNQKTILGVIYAPVLNDLYFSTNELGSFKFNPKENNLNLKQIIEESTRLPFSRKDNTFTIVASRSHVSKETEVYISEMRKKYINIKLISKGSSLKLCLVAEGIADCYPRFAPTMEWDTAAGQAICEHSGFKVIDWSSKKSMIYNRKELLNSWFIVKR